MDQETLEKLNKMELVSYANANFGLGVNKDYQKHDLIQMIVQAQRKFKGNAGIRVMDKGDTSKVPPGHMKIRVRPGKYDRTPRPIIIGHNFKLISVPVNRDVIMPKKYLPCFEDAVQDTYFQDEETKEFVCQREHAYSYSILEMGPDIVKETTVEIIDDDDEIAEEVA